jgi:hypothetical protein
MEEMLTINEIIGILKREGLFFTRDQVWSYVEMDILPRPMLVERGNEVSGGYPADMIEPLKRFLVLRDQGLPLSKAKGILLNENLLFVSDFLGKKGVNLQQLHDFALPNIEVNENGSPRTDRGFSQFFVDLAETTLWRGGEKREEKALQMLQRQLLKWKASLDAFWRKFEKIEAGDSWEKRGNLIRQSYAEVLSALNTPGAQGAAPV